MGPIITINCKKFDTGAIKHDKFYTVCSNKHETFIQCVQIKMKHFIQCVQINMLRPTNMITFEKLCTLYSVQCVQFNKKTKKLYLMVKLNI